MKRQKHMKSFNVVIVAGLTSSLVGRLRFSLSSKGVHNAAPSAGDAALALLRTGVSPLSGAEAVLFAACIQLL